MYSSFSFSSFIAFYFWLGWVRLGDPIFQVLRLTHLPPITPPPPPPSLFHHFQLFLRFKMNFKCFSRNLKNSHHIHNLALFNQYNNIMYFLFPSPFHWVSFSLLLYIINLFLDRWEVALAPSPVSFPIPLPQLCHIPASALYVITCSHVMITWSEPDHMIGAWSCGVKRSMKVNTRVTLGDWGRTRHN